MFYLIGAADFGTQVEILEPARDKGREVAVAKAQKSEVSTTMHRVRLGISSV